MLFLKMTACPWASAMRVTLEKFWFASDAETMALVLIIIRIPPFTAITPRKIGSIQPIFERGHVRSKKCAARDGRRMALYRVCAILGGKLAFLRNWRVHQGNNQVVLDVADIVFHAVEVVIHRHQRIVGEFFQPILNRPCRPFPPADPNSGFRRGMQLDHDSTISSSRSRLYFH